MSGIKVLLKKARPDVPDPVYATAGAAGCDVHADEDAFVPAGGRKLVKTGLYLELPPGYECQVRPRSGTALKHGVTVLNSPGTIDEDYRGELMVLLFNTNPETRDGKFGPSFHVKKGERIAQLVFAPVTRAQFQVVDELSDTARGKGGYGSTGTR